MRRVIVLIVGYSFFIVPFCSAQLAAGEKEKFTHADTLRGSITPERAWWNVLHYDIQVTPDYEKKSIKGVTGIRLQAIAAGKVLQIDLQEPLRIVSIRWRTTRQNLWTKPAPAALGANKNLNTTAYRRVSSVLHESITADNY